VNSNLFSHSGSISSALAAEMRGGGTLGLADGISTSPLPYHWNSRSMSPLIPISPVMICVGKYL
jgi:hypothetical protein